MKKVLLLLIAVTSLFIFVGNSGATTIYDVDFNNMLEGAAVQTGPGDDRPTRVNFGSITVEDFAGMDNAAYFNVAGRRTPAYDQLHWDFRSKPELNEYYISFDFATENFVGSLSQPYFTMLIDSPIVSNWYLYGNGGARYWSTTDGAYAPDIFQDGEINHFEVSLNMVTRTAITTINGMELFQTTLSPGGDIRSIRMNFGSFRSVSVNDQASIYIDNFHVADKPLAPIPEPATLSLLGLGLLGIAGIGRRQNS